MGCSYVEQYMTGLFIGSGGSREGAIAPQTLKLAPPIIAPPNTKMLHTQKG